MDRHSHSSAPVRRRGEWFLRGSLVALVAVLFAVVGMGRASAAALVSDDFEDGNAAGWTTTGGTWIVNQEETKVLRQSSFAVNALARIGQLAWSDYIITAQVKPESFNGLPGFAGVVSRASSTSTYYALVIRADNTAALTRTIGGTTVTLAAIRFSVSLDTTYTLTLRTSGHTLTGWVDGRSLSASDGFLFQGPAGLTTTWSVASFDNVVIAS